MRLQPRDPDALRGEKLMLFLLTFTVAPPAPEVPTALATFQPRRIPEAPSLPPDRDREARIERRRRLLARQARRLGVRL